MYEVGILQYFEVDTTEKGPTARDHIEGQSSGLMEDSCGFGLLQAE